MKSNLDFLLGCYGALCKDLEIPDKDQSTLLRRGRAEGITFFTVVLPRFSREILSSLECGHWTITSDFSHHNSTVLPKFLGKYLCELFDPITGIVRQPTKRSGQALYVIRQICDYAYKANFTSSDDDKNQSVIDSFIATDAALRDEVITTSSEVLVLAHEIVRAFLANYKPDLSGSFGPGICSDATQKEKYSSDFEDGPALREYYDTFVKDGRYFADILDPKSRSINMSHFSLFNRQLTSKVLLVPKDSRGPRLICCENTTNQWLQMSIMQSLYDYTEKHPMTSGNVNFTNQGVNQAIVKVASVNRDSWSTLDLKDASDRIRLDLVQFLFNGTSLLKPLLACRSPQFQTPDGKVRTFNKFAPMGSALCFPALAITIWALLSAKISLRSGRLVTDSVYVYGDDIICPSYLVDELIETLEGCSLKVNRSKSFSNSFFRESCGADYYFGVDVTPMRLRKPPTDEKCKEENSRNLVDHLNEMEGFTNLQAFLQREAERHLGKKIAYSSAPIPGTIRVLDCDPRLRENRSTRYIIQSKPKRSTIIMSDYSTLYRAFARIGTDTDNNVSDIDLRVQTWSLRKIRPTEWRVQ